MRSPNDRIPKSLLQNGCNMTMVGVGLFSTQAIVIPPEGKKKETFSSNLNFFGFYSFILPSSLSEKRNKNVPGGHCSNFSSA